ncbi:MAG: iron-containing alcohol dehydrogenase [Alphaproteobacteria bacterium]|nr:iron-containing alcohol dehydrogenase [Alphaproteobacteria bacterium]
MTGIFGALRLPASVVFGSGQRAAIGMMTAQIGKRALICTDARMGQDAQFKAIVADIQANGVEVKVYDRTEADLPIGGITGCVEDCAGFDPDVVLGIGGGSCMDMAKCVAVLLKHGGSLRDYYGENQIPGPVAPVIAVPTTSGTGSEVTPVAVIADTERGTKVGISSPYLIPRVAVCDPELTLTCPPGLTAVSGADALTHAIESFTAARRQVTPDLTVKNVFVGKNALSDTFGLLALKNIFEALPTAVKDGANLEAREKMMLASLSAGCAFGTAGTAAAHAIQYPVGNETHTPHGMGVALLMPYVMEYNRPSSVAAFAEIARAIGLTGTDEELSHKLIDAVAALLAEIKIPVTLKELGLPEDKQDWTAESAIGAARLVNNNPRKLDVDAMKAITRAAFSGDRASLSS